MPTEHELNMECRKAVRAYLAERGLPFGIDTITNGVRNAGGHDRNRITAACAFLLSRKHVEELTDPDGGGLKYYRITADGTVAYENGN